jgi:hypothetical protein
MLRSTRENFCRAQAYEIITTLFDKFRTPGGLVSKQGERYLGEKLDAMIGQYADHIEDVAKRYERIAADGIKWSPLPTITLKAKFPYLSEHYAKLANMRAQWEIQHVVDSTEYEWLLDQVCPTHEPEEREVSNG